MARKKRINIQAMNATKTKYDKPFSTKDFIKMASIPGLYLAGLTYVIWYRPFVSIVFFGIGVLYGLAVLIPQNIQVEYLRKSLRMRNRMLGNIAQSINRENATVLDVLTDVAQNRLQGELQQQVYSLTGRLGGSDEERTAAYMSLLEAYPADPIFQQFIEHLLTIDLHGRANTDALDETVELHNKMVERQEIFISDKFIKIMYYGLNTIVGVGLLLLFQWIGGVAMLNDFTKYIDGFAHSLPGTIFGGMFVAATLYYNHKGVVSYADENLMEV